MKTEDEIVDFIEARLEPLKRIEVLTKENQDLKDEILKLRILARLADLISRVDGANERQYKELLEFDRKHEALWDRYEKLKIEAEAATSYVEVLKAKKD